VVYDLLDPALDYLNGTAEARASVAIQYGVFTKSFPACLEKGVLLCVKTNTLI